MTSFISCYNNEGQLEHFKVPKEVAVYIKQLETYINNPAQSKLLERYSFRFGYNKT